MDLSLSKGLDDRDEFLNDKDEFYTDTQRLFFATKEDAQLALLTLGRVGYSATLRFEGETPFSPECWVVEGER